MSLLFLVKRDWGIKDILKSFEDPGRRKGKPKGTHLDESVALRQSIALCLLCKNGFNPRGKGYAVAKRMPTCRGKCDACREHDDVLYLYMPVENLHVLGGRIV